MNIRSRRERAILRNRRRGDVDGPPFIGPMTGYELFLANRYQTEQIVRLVAPPDRVAEALAIVRNWTPRGQG
ncbi:hypothetical protein ACFRCW_42330 [Streptomyces sp. NPDC056653]|uniref:hypothetical protein n=1 Tax=Streptomyces sp. NPDC056653 TaxID=3345894 RepID=UPI00367992E4